MRHATAEPFAATDLDRELTAQGAADAGAAGEWLATEHIVVDHVLVSSAARSRRTWAELAESAALAVEPELDESLVAAGPESLLDVLRMVDDEVGTLLVVGHNPTVAHLAQMLDNGDGESSAVDAMATGFPPCALAIFTLEGTWEELELGSARLRAFHVARG